MFDTDRATTSDFNRVINHMKGRHFQSCDRTGTSLLIIAGSILSWWTHKKKYQAAYIQEMRGRSKCSLRYPFKEFKVLLFYVQHALSYLFLA